MRADVPDLLEVGDRVTITQGVHEGLDGEVVEVAYLVYPWAGRARLRLPCPHGEYWHPFWSDPMDEAEWLTTKDTAAMERHLLCVAPDDRRRWRLLGAACARAVLPRLVDLKFREACAELVEASERYAEGRAERREFARARERAVAAFPMPSRLSSEQEWYAGNAVLRACRGEVVVPVGNWVLHAGLGGNAQRALMRCVFGNPFRGFNVDPAWLAWQGGLIPSLARGIRDERRYGEMSVLGDALEDAGCADEAALAHCRAGPHARGCWVLDAILGTA